jgi:hypothetical protein
VEQYLLIVLPGFVFWYICKNNSKDIIRPENTQATFSVSEKNSQIKLLLPFLFSGLQFFVISTSILFLLNMYLGDITVAASLKNSLNDYFLINLLIATLVSAASADYFLTANNTCFNKYSLKFLLPIHQHELTDLYVKLADLEYLIITLNSKKVYYGVIASCEGESLLDCYIEFYPFASGYRDDLGQVVLTDDYAEYIKKDFGSSTIVRYTEIQSIVKYDHEYFNYKNNFRKLTFVSNAQIDQYLKHKF